MKIDKLKINFLVQKNSGVSGTKAESPLWKLERVIQYSKTVNRAAQNMFLSVSKSDPNDEYAEKYLKRA